MVGFALAAGLKSRLRTRETPPFFAKNPSRPSNASKKWNKKKKSPESFESTNNSELSHATGWA